MRRSAVVLVAALLVVAMPAPVLAEQEIVRVKTLTTSQWTNGTEKSFVLSWSYSDCGNIDADVTLTVFYDKLTATQFRVTRAKARYYVHGPSTSAMWGGWLGFYGGDYNSWFQTYEYYYVLPPNRDDYHTRYNYNPNTKDADGYSFVGSFVHPGPATITVDADDQQVNFTKLSNVVSSVCAGDFVYLSYQVRW